ARRDDGAERVALRRIFERPRACRAPLVRVTAEKAIDAAAPLVGTRRADEKIFGSAADCGTELIAGTAAERDDALHQGIAAIIAASEREHRARVVQEARCADVDAVFRLYNGCAEAIALLRHRVLKRLHVFPLRTDLAEDVHAARALIAHDLGNEQIAVD